MFVMTFGPKKTRIWTTKSLRSRHSVPSEGITLKLWQTHAPRPLIEQVRVRNRPCYWLCSMQGSRIPFGNFVVLNERSALPRVLHNVSHTINYGRKNTMSRQQHLLLQAHNTHKSVISVTDYSGTNKCYSSIRKQPLLNLTAATFLFNFIFS